MSKELDALKRAKMEHSIIKLGFPEQEYFNDLDAIEKELKALDIIKEKMVNVGDFARCKGVEDYNEYCCYGKEETLTQEEYDLLREVLL